MTNLNNNVLSKISDILLQDGRKFKDFISNIIIKDKNVGFSIDTTEIGVEEASFMREKAIEKLNEISDIGRITIALTSQKTQNEAKNHDRFKAKQTINGVKNVILVAAGKGGVGKSTMSALIAEQLNSLGYKIGIVDADIYGPSIPQIFGINQKPEIINNKMIPLISRNIQIISIGFLTQGEAIAWRGPMASKAIYQLLSLSAWNNLDYLIVDTPPGTGDIHLSILENYQISGVTIVTTPQKISQIDVEKAIKLYQKFDVPILGVIENMSYLVDSSNKKLEIFSGNSGEYLSKKYNLPIICKLPIVPELAKACDDGVSSNMLTIPMGVFINIL